MLIGADESCVEVVSEPVCIGPLPHERRSTSGRGAVASGKKQRALHNVMQIILPSINFPLSACIFAQLSRLLDSEIVLPC